MKQQELKTTKSDFSLITTFHYTHQNLSPFDSTPSYKIFLSNTTHYSSFLYCIDTPSIVQSTILRVLEPFFQHCKYPRCCLIKFFCDPFQSHKQTWKWLMFKQMSANRYFFFLSLDDDEKCSLPNGPFQRKDSSPNKTCVALYLGSKRTHSAEWPDAFIKFPCFSVTRWCHFCFPSAEFLSKSQLSKNKYNRAPYFGLASILPQEQGKAQKSHYNYCKWIFQKT